MLCAVLRPQRPELATAVSLAAGVAVLAALGMAVRARAGELSAVWTLLARADGQASGAVLRAAGIAIASELGAQLCTDAGERALAGRVRLASRVAILGLCLPLIAGIAESLSGLLP